MLTIVDWNERYEKSDTRKCKDMKWVPVPNRWDSIGYLAIMDLPDALAVMGAWMLILEVASRCEHRGILAEAGQPLTPAMIAAKVRAPLKGINRAIDVLSSPAISWISNSIESHPDDIPASREIIPGTREIIPTTGQDRTGQDRTGQDKKAGFAPPTVDEVAAYVREKGYHFDPAEFMAYYETRNWIPNNAKRQMTSWRSACTTWEGYWKQKNSTARTPQKSPSNAAHGSDPHKYDHLIVRSEPHD